MSGRKRELESSRKQYKERQALVGGLIESATQYYKKMDAKDEENDLYIKAVEAHKRVKYIEESLAYSSFSPRSKRKLMKGARKQVRKIQEQLLAKVEDDVDDDDGGGVPSGDEDGD